MVSTFDQIVPTQDGSFTARHPLYDEDFHAKQGARFEAYQLYMAESGFLAYLSQQQEPCLVLDVGLGLGYNALMTIESWWLQGGHQPLSIISLEHTPELVAAFRDPACLWKLGWSDEWREWSQALLAEDQGLYLMTREHPRSGQPLRWEVWVGDARDARLPPCSIQFIWQDAFSPKKNPELWTPGWFTALRLASRSSAVLMSYSVARTVKDALAASGWAYERLRAPGHKKQWLRATPEIGPDAAARSSRKPLDSTKGL